MQRTQRIYKFTQAPTNRNRAVIFPAELVLKVKFFLKINSLNFSTFFTCCATYDASQI